VDQQMELRVSLGGGLSLAGPYPGLRPFYEHERPIFFGRERQVREVIERLRLSHFVAVLGGSGTGKSSIVRAGVIPELRSFAIEERGDLWLPVTFVPGTSGDPHDQPLDRLAKRLIEKLMPNAVDRDQLRAELVRLFLQRNGLHAFVEQYASHFVCDANVNPANANLLLVIDQFEELFHPANRGKQQSVALIDRVIDTFPEIRSTAERHPRLYLALTMRTEHLNDCIAYDGLPEAINLGAYLIGRLSDDDIHDAIVRPPRRFVQLLKRQFPHAPERFECMPDFVDCLVDDARRVRASADQLPLLQHALFWAWRYACNDALGGGEALPGTLAIAQLRRPDGTPLVQPGALQDPTDTAIMRAAGWSVAESTGRSLVLRPSLEAQAEHVYSQRLDDRERVIAEALFRRLAFFDPTAKNYTQDRVDLEVFARAAGFDPDAVRAVVRKFMEPHSYLMEEKLTDPPGTRVKVAHESLIRGWDRFRHWIDNEADRFRDFRGMLDKCGEWLRDNRSDAMLLDDRALKAAERIKLAAAFTGDKEPLERLKHMVGVLDDADRYQDAVEHVDTFFAASVAARTRREQRQDRQKRNVRLLGAAAALTLATTVILVGTKVRDDRLKETEKLLVDKEANFLRSFGIAGVTRKSLSNQFDQAIDAYQPLLQVLVASRLLQEGTHTYEADRQYFTDNAMRKQRFDNSRWLAETMVTQTLQEVLTLGAWHRGKGGAGDVLPPRRGPVTMRRGEPRIIETKDAAPCAGLDKGSLTGKLFSARDESMPARRWRALFVEQAAEQTNLYSAVVDATGCHLLQPLISYLRSTGADAKPVVPKALDQTMSTIVVDIPTNSGHGTQFLAVEWNDVNGNQVAFRQREFTLLDQTVDLAGPSMSVVQARRREAGHEININGERFRFFATRPLRERTFDDEAWVQLSGAQATKSCDRVKAAAGPSQGGDGRTYYEPDTTWCVELVAFASPQGPSPPRPGSDAPPSPNGPRNYLVNFYSNYANVDVGRKPTPVASVSFGSQAQPPRKLYVGKPGAEREGFVAAEFGEDIFTSPWQLSAWTRLGCDVVRESGMLPLVQQQGLDFANLKQRPVDQYRSDYNIFATNSGGDQLIDVEKRICTPLVDSAAASSAPAKVSSGN
jgi:hypothetical protein